MPMMLRPSIKIPEIDHQSGKGMSRSCVILKYQCAGQLKIMCFFLEHVRVLASVGGIFLQDY